MIRRVQALFDRFAARHLVLSLPPVTLPDGIGRVERLLVRQGRLQISGRSAARTVTLSTGGVTRSVAPVSAADGGPPQFQIDLPWLPAPIELDLDGRRLPLPQFSAPRVALARLSLLPAFLRAGMRSLPATIRWFRDQDPRARAEVKRHFGLDLPDTPLALDPRWLDAPTGEMAANRGEVTIILPVYDGFDLLSEALQRLDRNTDAPFHLILIDDASPDPRILPALENWRSRLSSSTRRVTLLRNAANLGFVGTVNRGLEAALASGDGPVILLNSDAFVPPGWVGRLTAPLADLSVASVTPMSNDAELLTVPRICAPLPLRPGEADRIDAVASRLGAAFPEMPTGVGFCMALSRSFLKRFPSLDPVFGRGYGEEVDWARKVAAIGGRHVAQPALFVEHRGGGSFGSAKKQALLRRNGAILSARYPTFDVLVQGFLSADPLATPRLILALAWANARAGDRPVPVYLGHALGGGAERSLADRIVADLGPDGPGAAVVLRVGAEFRWRIEVHSPAGTTTGGTEDTGLVRRLLDLLERRHVIYSCGAGHIDEGELPAFLCDLATGAAHRSTVLFHDYLPISPSYTLLDADGVFRGVPVPPNPDPAHEARREGGARCTLADWQAAWGRLIARSEVVTFSDSSREIVATAYPAIADRIIVAPHAVPAPPSRAAASVKPGAPEVIGVLGNIGSHKGAGVLVSLSRLLGKERRTGLVVIGTVDPRFVLRRPARVHGPYDLADLPALIRRYGITRWFIPSIWPETFSYVTHEALATGLPVWTFDLGAQAEAVRKAMAGGAGGGVIPLDAARSPATLLRQLLTESGAAP